MRIVAMDTETALFRPGVMAPELVCVSFQEQGQRAQLVHVRESEPLLRGWLEDPEIHLVGHNLSYDAAVILAAFPHLLDLVFAAYDAGRMHCTQVRENLLDIALGRFRFEEKPDGTRVARGYSLDDLSSRYRGKRLDKDTWRLRYVELVGLPVSEWPEGAQEYPKEDAVATLAAYEGQERICRPRGVYLLEDAADKTRRAFALHLMSAWGLRTDAVRVAAFARQTEANLLQIEGELIEAGLVRPNGVRDTKAAAARMIDICKELGVPVPRTAKEGVCLDADACLDSGDPLLQLYAKLGQQKSALSKDVPLLEMGAKYPIHARFSILKTGRTSSSPNVQNLGRGGDVRSCFVPRKGMVFAQADYASLELHTLSQVCLDILGQSKLAEVLNSGEDPHTHMAAKIGGVSLAEAKALKKAKDKQFDRWRQSAKVANFGFPGGLGPKSLVAFAKATYGVILTEPEARGLKGAWQAQWTEMPFYFAHVNGLMKQGKATLKQVRSNRYRGGALYTEACNSYFQGLGADAASRATWLLAKACYLDRASSLYGSRVVNFVHDEFFTETPDNEGAHDAAHEQVRLMIAGANEVLPDVPARTDPVLMRWWSKDAQAVFVNGRLVPWFGNCSTVVGVSAEGEEKHCGSPLVVAERGVAACQDKGHIHENFPMPWLDFAGALSIAC